MSSWSTSLSSEIPLADCTEGFHVPGHATHVGSLLLVVSQLSPLAKVTQCLRSAPLGVSG